MNDLKQTAAFVCVLIAGGFLLLLGAVFMTGVRLDNFGDLAVFLGWNGMVVAIVVLAIRNIVSQSDKSAGDD